MSYLAFGSTTISLLSAAATAISGWYWYRASKVNIVPHWVHNGTLEPLDPVTSQTEWIISLIKTGKKSGEINRKAALWTALAAFLAVLSTILSALASIQPVGS